MLGFFLKRTSKLVIGLGVVALTTTEAFTSTLQQSSAAQQVQSHSEPTKAEILRGGYGPYRANNDLLFYHLDVRVDPENKFISGKNTIRFKMLKDDNRIQLDLSDALKIDKILLDATQLKYERDSGAVFVDFPETSRRVASIPSTFIILAPDSRRAGSAASLSRKIPQAAPGFTPLAKGWCKHLVAEQGPVA